MLSTFLKWHARVMRVSNHAVVRFYESLTKQDKRISELVLSLMTPPSQATQVTHHVQFHSWIWLEERPAVSALRDRLLRANPRTVSAHRPGPRVVYRAEGDHGHLRAHRCCHGGGGHRAQTPSCAARDRAFGPTCSLSRRR